VSEISLHVTVLYTYRHDADCQPSSSSLFSFFFCPPCALFQRQSQIPILTVRRPGFFARKDVQVLQNTTRPDAQVHSKCAEGHLKQSAGCGDVRR
jgi:hypothetical protein